MFESVLGTSAHEPVASCLTAPVPWHGSTFHPPVVAPLFNLSAGVTPQLEKCTTCRFAKSHWGWLLAQGYPDHDDIFRPDHRSEAVWSMVHLVNLAMFSDPVVWLRLYVFNRRLYANRVTTSGTFLPDEHCPLAARLLLLPCDPAWLSMSLTRLRSLGRSFCSTAEKHTRQPSAMLLTTPALIVFTKFGFIAGPD